MILQEDVCVPARSQVDVPGKVVFRGRPSGQDSLVWGTKPATIVEGVHVARTLTPVDKQPCFIKSGTVISDLEPVVVVEASEARVSAISRGDETEVKTCKDPESSSDTPQFVEQLIEGVDPATPESAVIGLNELLISHRAAFSESEYDLGLTGVVEHRIETGSARPVRQHLRRYPPAHLEVIS